MGRLDQWRVDFRKLIIRKFEKLSPNVHYFEDVARVVSPARDNAESGQRVRSEHFVRRVCTSFAGKPFLAVAQAGRVVAGTAPGAHIVLRRAWVVLAANDVEELALARAVVRTIHPHG